MPNKLEATVATIILGLLAVTIIMCSGQFTITPLGIRLSAETKIGDYSIYVDEDGDLVAFNRETETFSIIAYADYDATTVPMEDVDENKMRLRNKQ